LKKFGYNIVRFWIKTSLHLYFGKIETHGLQNVPQNKPVIFLPNHQNALLDVLLIGVDCNRKPWFLTRSDIFKSKTLMAIFEFLQMIPIYRMRDGRESLKNNQAVFDRCSDLLRRNEAVILFPEANHNLQRRVRTLSKGFTRILFNTLAKDPDTDIQVVPVGLNYKEAVRFPDKVAVFFGKPISVKDWYLSENEKISIDQVKKVVSDQLKTLTTHIEDEASYEAAIDKLNAAGVDFLNPKEANLQLKNALAIGGNKPRNSTGIVSKVFKGVFTLLNLPLVLPWRLFVKPKVWEPEFMGTLRFAFALLVYPLYYLLLFLILVLFMGTGTGLAVVFGVFVFNWVFVKWSGI